jgi:catechol 2,3-dioxygenase-like lactoylglutathione lyase family enzyme
MTFHPSGIGAITLFVEDVGTAKQFYATALDLPVHFEDDVSVVFKMGDTLLNLLQATEAHSLIAPARVAPSDSGARMQLTIDVDDVDAACDELRRRGIELLNGPMDRPWGIRTAAFRDTDGHVWEIAH